MHSPLKLVLLMLGSNDFQCTHDNNAWLSAQGIATLVRIIRQAPVEPGMPIPNIMIIAPPKISRPKGLIANKFKGAETRCIGQPEELKKIADKLGTDYFDANTVIESSLVDGIHLDEIQHEILGKALANAVSESPS